jgi:hypothetical protein
VFSAEGGGALIGNDTPRLGPPERVTTDVLNRYPVEILAIEETLQPTRSQPRFWVKWINKCKQANLPDYVSISAPSNELRVSPGNGRFRIGVTKPTTGSSAPTNMGVLSVKIVACLSSNARTLQSPPSSSLPESIPMVVPKRPQICLNQQGYRSGRGSGSHGPLGMTIRSG